MSKKSGARPEGYNQNRVKENILKAWDRGRRSFDEVVQITGYKPRTVDRYIPNETEKIK